MLILEWKNERVSKKQKTKNSGLSRYLERKEVEKHSKTNESRWK